MAGGRYEALRSGRSAGGGDVLGMGVRAARWARAIEGPQDQGGEAAMRYELQRWLHLAAFALGVLAVVTAALALSAPTIDLIALR